jgi:hypothetical protein
LVSYLIYNCLGPLFAIQLSLDAIKSAPVSFVQ